MLIFYSGHGNWDATAKNGYWLPADAKKDSKSNWVSNSDIKDYIKSIGSQHTLLIADACFSGGIFKSRGGAFEGSSKSIKEFYKYPSRKGMTSGALTTVPDRSKFLEFLVKRLNDNQEKYLPVMDLFLSLRDAVSNNSPSTPQYGTIQGAGDEGGEFIFIRKNVEKAKTQEEMDWEKAKLINSILAYETYLGMYPQGNFTFEAKMGKVLLEKIQSERNRIEQLQADETAWVEAQKVNTIIAYEEYLNLFPQGKYKSEASKTISVLAKNIAEKLSKEQSQADEKAWLETKKSNTIVAYEEYLKSFPQGKYKTEASKTKSVLEKNMAGMLRKKQLQDDEIAWLGTKYLNTTTAYDDYLKNYPQGIHSKEAQSAKATAEKEPKEADSTDSLIIASILSKTKDNDSEEVEEIFTIVEVGAEPIGGYSAFYDFLNQNLKYPSQARRMGIEGKVYVQFLVDKDGTLTEIKVVKGIGGGCDEEAARLIGISPKWKAGKQRGKAVKQRIVIQIAFKLDKK